jgi:Holliday junction resolvase-like predicted endonuclease
LNLRLYISVCVVRLSELGASSSACQACNSIALDRCVKIFQVVRELCIKMGAFICKFCLKMGGYLCNEGKLAERFVAQHLIRLGSENTRPRLHYWLRERKQQNAEVDFVVQIGASIVPVEVKAGQSGRMRSLIQFVAQKKVSTVVRFDLTPPSISRVSQGLADHGEVSCNLLSLPLYAVGQLTRVYC